MFYYVQSIDKLIENLIFFIKSYIFFQRMNILKYMHKLS